MKTKDGIDFQIGMTLYLAASGRIVELITKGMRTSSWELCLGCGSHTTINLWYGRHENAAQAAIVQLQEQITDLQQDIEALQRESQRRAKERPADESRRRRRDPSLLRSDALSGEQRPGRRSAAMAVA